MPASAPKPKPKSKAKPKPKPAAPKPTEPTLSFGDASAFESWLAEHHAVSGPVMLRIAKAGAARSITYAEALDVALAWGWIDSQKRALDATAFLQRFGRRTRTSPWSKINCGKVEALLASGRMRAPGLVEVDRAKADGRWERAYDGARTATVPEDLAAALAKNRAARSRFEQLDAANRYAILYRVHTAKKPETRADRIAKLVAMCARGESIHPVRRARTR